MMVLAVVLTNVVVNAQDAVVVVEDVVAVVSVVLIARAGVSGVINVNVVAIVKGVERGLMMIVVVSVNTVTIMWENLDIFVSGIMMI
jgi:hypothetical protein